MKKTISLLLALVLCLSLCACGEDKPTTNAPETVATEPTPVGLTTDMVVGEWILESGNCFAIFASSNPTICVKMNIVKGGEVEVFKEIDGTTYSIMDWEIVDGVLKISSQADFTGTGVSSIFELDGEKLVSADRGTSVFVRK